MADKALENALARRDELAKKINTAQQQLDDWKRELARADAFISDWHAFAGSPHTHRLIVDGTHLDIKTHEVEMPRPKNTKKEVVAQHARELIEARGSPIPRTELYQLLTQDRGLTIEGSDPEMVLSTMLWRMRDKVVRLKTGGYWLAEKPWARTGYYPGDREDLSQSREGSDELV